MRNKIIQLGYTSLDADELIKVSKNIEEDYNKLLNNYPIQYLIGYVNFYGNKINFIADMSGDFLNIFFVFKGNNNFADSASVSRNGFFF